MTRRTVLSVLAASSLLPFAAYADEVDLSPEQKGRVRADKDPDAVRLISGDVKLARPGYLTVANASNRLPFGVYATDMKTLVSSEPDIIQLVSHALGLQLNLVPVAWADWPLGIVSGKYDTAVSNITVTEERKEKFDFSTYRKDQIGFFVSTGSPIRAIAQPQDVAGLRVMVASGTNREQILLRWIKDNAAKGQKPTEVHYYDDAVRYLALGSGGRTPISGRWRPWGSKAASDGKTRLVGSFSGGWPAVAEIAVVTRRGGGLADAITHALNTQISNGNYAKYLARWHLVDDAVERARTNPPGLPKLRLGRDRT